MGLEVVKPVEDPLQVGALVLERGLLQHQVALLHRRAEDHVAPHTDQRGLGPGLQRRDLDHEIAAGAGPAGQPPAVAQLVGGESARVDVPPGTSPETIRTLHFLHVPWPPQVESMAIPFQLAASKIGVPLGTRTSPPSGRKRSRTRCAPSARGRLGLALERGDGLGDDALMPSAPPRCEPRGLPGAVGGDPARAPRVVAEQQVRRRGPPATQTSAVDMIALVSPAAIAIGKKPALST